MYLKEYSIKIMISCLKSLLLIYASTLLYGCGVTRSSSKYNFSDGYYYSKLNGNRSKKYYVASSGDSIKVYPADIAKQNADTIKSITVLFPPNKKPLNFQQYKFRALGLDLTVISIVVKYRPAVKIFLPSLIILSTEQYMQVIVQIIISLSMRIHHYMLQTEKLRITAIVLVALQG
jgi:hypothetical protein